MSLLGSTVAAAIPFYLIIVGGADQTHKEIIPIYSNKDACIQQAINVTNILHNGVNIDSLGMRPMEPNDYSGNHVYSTPPYAFCIETGAKSNDQY